jgi:23S rRNA pseudouridine1911/1915/1917 synthase
VWGWPAEDEFEVDAPLLRRSDIEDSPVWVMQMVHPQGAASLTRFRVEKRFERQTSNGSQFSLIRAFPHTGRMHQIRLHLQHCGFPVVGDKIYGINSLLYLDHIRDGWTPALEAQLLMNRHALHSCAMTVAFEEEPRRWEAPLDEYLRVFVEEPDQPLPMEEPFQMHLPALQSVRWRDFSPAGGTSAPHDSAE